MRSLIIFAVLVVLAMRFRPYLSRIYTVCKPPLIGLGVLAVLQMIDTTARQGDTVQAESVIIWAGDRLHSAWTTADSAVDTLSGWGQ